MQPPPAPTAADVEALPEEETMTADGEPVPEVARGPKVADAAERDLHALLVHAVAEAVEAVEARRTRDALHILVTAQEEHQALMVAAIRQVRDDCNATMIRLADRLTAATERLASAFETYTGAAIPAALAEASEQARMSAGEIHGALRTMVKQNHYVIEALSVQRERDDRLVELLGHIHAAVEGTSDPATDAEPSAEGTPGPSSRHTPPSDPPEAGLYERLTDIMDDFDEEEMGAQIVANEEPGHVH